MIRSFNINHNINIGKQKTIINLIKEYRKFSSVVSNELWKEFFNTGKINKYLNIKHLETFLSERYKRNSTVQVSGVISSFISNLKNDFNKIVYKSSLNQETRKNLSIINKYNLWFEKEDVKLKNITINLSDIKLSRKIFNKLLSLNNKPDVRYISLAANSNVVDIKHNNVGLKLKKSIKLDKYTFNKENINNINLLLLNQNYKNQIHYNIRKLSSFDYWTKLSIIGEKPIYLPFKSNSYLEKKSQKITNYLQINLNKENKLSFAVVKNFETIFKKQKEEYTPLVEELGIDLGLSTLFSTSNEKMYGKRFIDTLYYYDIKIQKLVKSLQKQNIKPNKSSKYRNVVKKLREYIKNETNYNLNKIIEENKPKRLIIEKLDFKSPTLSKRLNRVLSNFGKQNISNKFNSLNEEYGIEIEEVNPAYTSQTCNDCNYVDKRNRKTQSEFCCVYCNLKENIKKLNIKEFKIEVKNINNKEVFFLNNIELKMNLIKTNADVNATKNILLRSSKNKKFLNISLFDTKGKVLEKLVSNLLNQIPKNHNSLVKSLNNMYFSL